MLHLVPELGLHCLHVSPKPGRAVTNVVRTCGPTHLLVFDFMSNKVCLNKTMFILLGSEGKFNTARLLQYQVWLVDSFKGRHYWIVLCYSTYNSLRYFVVILESGNHIL